MWKLILVQFRDESQPGSTTVPIPGPRDGDSGNHPSQQTTETGDDEFGTTVVEVSTTTTTTTTTNTTTTRKKYRVEGS